MKATKKELEAEAKKRYKKGQFVDQRTAYTLNGKPAGNVFEIESTKVSVTEEPLGNESTYLNVSVGGTGVYNTIDNKWAEIIEKKKK